MHNKNIVKPIHELNSNYTTNTCSWNSIGNSALSNSGIISTESLVSIEQPLLSH